MIPTKKHYIAILLTSVLLFFTFCTGYYFGNQHNYITVEAKGSAQLDVPPQSTAYEPITTVQPAKRININTATAKELDELPGIGETLAERIVAYREEHGPYKHIEELSRVKGISLNMVMEFADLITLGGNE